VSARSVQLATVCTHHVAFVVIDQKRASDRFHPRLQAMQSGAAEIQDRLLGFTSSRKFD
jgi:hypothetical protein